MRLDGIEGRVALVTGASKGIGRCIAETLRDQGASVAAGARAAPDLDGVLGLEMDVGSTVAVEEASADVITIRRRPAPDAEELS